MDRMHGKSHVNDAYWRKRKKRIEKMLDHFQKTGWKTGGFTVYNCDELRRRLYKQNDKYNSLLLQEGSADRAGSVDGKAERDSIEMDMALLKYEDIVRRSDDIQYVRKYQRDGREITVRNKEVKVQAKVGSMENKDHKPGGGKVQIINKPIRLAEISSKVGSLDNVDHKAGGGSLKIPHHQVKWSSQSKIGSLDNLSHQPTGGDKSIFHDRLSWNGQAKVGSLDNIDHVPSRSYRTLLDYMTPMRQKLVNRKDVLWTEGYDKTALSDQTLNRLNPLPTISTNKTKRVSHTKS